MKKIKVNKIESALFANPDIVFREEGKEALLFDPSNGSIKVLNPTAKIIWKSLDGKNSLSKLREKLEKKFKDEDPKRIESDIKIFLKKLEGFGYLGKKI